jgi:hypothetical protein
VSVPLSERIARYMAEVEPAISGQHGHNQTLWAASVLVWGFGLSEAEAWPFAVEYNARCMPPWSERDLQRKLHEALRNPGQKPRGWLLGEPAQQAILPAAPLPEQQPTWPKPDLQAIDSIVRNGPALSDLREQSPIGFQDDASHAEQIIDALFPGNPLLCCAKSNQLFATRRREVWRGKLSTLPLMVPNPMLAIKGPTKDGRLSEHSQSATARRVYLCIEFDFTEKAKDGVTDTVWAPLVRRWRADKIQVLDACAALILYLNKRLPKLVSVCFSGGKSLHAWFYVLPLNPTEQRGFMNYAVELGADHATWNRAQLVRIPDGRRPSGILQVCHYFDPHKAVQYARESIVR